MEEKNRFKLQFAFQRTNYLLMFGGLFIVIIGYILMSGGGSGDPNVFLGDYYLSEESFERLQDEFKIDDSYVQQLQPLKDKVFEGEEELMNAMSDAIGAEALADNYFQLRSATEIDAAIFSGRRISLAPLVVILGYGFIFFAIMYKPRDVEVAS